VDLEDQDSGDQVTYQIVGEDEADIKLGKISVNSPDRAPATDRQIRNPPATMRRWQVQDPPGGLREFQKCWPARRSLRCLLGWGPVP
jgi:transcription elongation factor GreA